MMKKIVSVLLVLSLVFAIGAEFNPSTSYDVGYSNGRRDGRDDASWLWAFSGGCGCFGWAAAYFIPGDVPTEMIIGQDPNYARGYTDAYVKAKRWRQVMWSVIGTIVAGAIGGGASTTVQ